MKKKAITALLVSAMVMSCTSMAFAANTDTTTQSVSQTESSKSKTAGSSFTLKPITQNLEYRDTVAPAGIQSFSAKIDGWDRTWKEYVPASYNGKKAIPLVIAVHGGSNHTAHTRTNFALVAERENFIVLYPESIKEGTSWNIWNTQTAADGMPDDEKYFSQLIDATLKKYNIDKTRIYITGQSMGDMMTTNYIMQHGDMFAASAPLSGPTFPNYLIDNNGNLLHTPKASLPVVRTHGTNDFTGVPASITDETAKSKYKMESVNVFNKQIWIDENNCSELPLLKTTQDKNYEIYKSKDSKNDFVYYTVQGGEHNPTLDMADYVWEYFLKPYQRVNGKVIKNKTDKSLEPDKGAVALAIGSDKAYVDNKLTSISGANGNVKTAMINGTFYVPVKFLEKAFPGTKVTMADEGQSATIKYKNSVTQVARGNWVMIKDDTLQAIKRVEYTDGELMVPIKDIAEYVYGFNTYINDNAAYIVDHEGVLTYDMSYEIKVVLGTQKKITYKEAYDLYNQK